jgi:hypothetical protein
MLTVLLVIMLHWSVSVNASLQYRCSSRDLEPDQDVPSHDGIRFPLEDYNVTGAVLIDLNSAASMKVFDYCDPNSYSPERIYPLLAMHGLDNSFKFILLFSALKMDCDPQHYNSPVDTFNINKVSLSWCFFFFGSRL